MSGHEWEVVIGLVLVIAGALVRTLFARAESTGRRIGKLESEADYRRGYDAGRRAGLREKAKGHDR